MILIPIDCQFLFKIVDLVFWLFQLFLENHTVLFKCSDNAFLLLFLVGCLDACIERLDLACFKGFDIYFVQLTNDGPILSYQLWLSFSGRKLEFRHDFCVQYLWLQH